MTTQTWDNMPKIFVILLPIVLLYTTENSPSGDCHLPQAQACLNRRGLNNGEPGRKPVAIHPDPRLNVWTVLGITRTALTLLVYKFLYVSRQRDRSLGMGGEKIESKAKPAPHG